MFCFSCQPPVQFPPHPLWFPTLLTLYAALRGLAVLVVLNVSAKRGETHPVCLHRIKNIDG